MTAAALRHAMAEARRFLAAAEKMYGASSDARSATGSTTVPGRQPSSAPAWT